MQCGRKFWIFVICAKCVSVLFCYINVLHRSRLTGNSWLTWNSQDIGVDNRVKARYEVTHFSDNDDGLSDSEESEVVPKPKRMEIHGDGSLKEVKRDGSLRGIGDSPIALDYTPSDDFEMNVSPLEPFQEETNNDVMNFTIEDESPRVDVMDPEEIPVQIETEEIPVQIETEEIPVQIETGEIPVQIEEVPNQREPSGPDKDEEVSDDPETDLEVAQVLGSRSVDKDKATMKLQPQDSPHQVASDEEVENFNLVVLKHISAQRQVLITLFLCDLEHLYTVFSVHDTFETHLFTSAVISLTIILCGGP